MAEYLMNLSVLDDMGKELYMRDLIKKVTLIVNVDCKVGGESNNECPELEALYLRHKDKGFEILAFPCDQFQLGSKARCTAADVKADLVKRYGISFPILGKVNVNGDHAHPLFIFLQKRLSGFATDMIKWDFTKFLLVDGEPRKRYSPTTSPHSLEAEIAQALATHSVLIGDEGTNLSSSSISQDSVKPWQQDTDASQQKGYLAMQPQIREQQQQQYQQPPQQFGLGDQGITQPTPTQTAYPYQQGYDVDCTTTPSTGARVESAMESTKATLSEKYEQAKNTLSNVGERVGQATGLSSSAKSQEPLLIRVNNKDQGYDFGSGMGMQQQDTLSRRNIQPESWTSSDRGFVSQPSNDNVDLSYGGDNSRWREGDEDRFGDINRDRDINVMPQFQQGYDMAGDNQQSDFFGGRGLSQREGNDSLLQDRGIVDRGIVGRRQDDVERGDDKLYGYDDDSNKQQQQQWQPQQQRDIGRDDNTNLQGYDFGTRSTQYGQRNASLTPMQQLHREGLGQQQQQQFGGSGPDEQRIQQSIDRTPHNMHNIIKELEHGDNSGLGSGIVHGARDERLASQEPEFVQDSNVDSMDKLNDNWNAQSQWPQQQQQQQQPFSQQQQLPQWQQQQPQQPFMQQQQPYMQQGGQVPHSQVKVSDLVKEFESGAHLNDKQM